MIRTLLLFIFLALLTVTVKAAPRACIPSSTSCEFYSCMEQRTPCGPRGYWKQLGLHYCQKFLFREDRFSEQAQAWLHESRLCLQERTKLVSKGLACSQVQSAAMDTHVSCYVDTGFCELSLADKNKIIWYLLSALRFPSVWHEFWQVSRLCAN